MNSRRWFVAFLFVLPAPVLGQTGYSITGGLSNFDCGNRCDEPCDEFEIEIDGLHPEDVMHTYRNGNYGSPTVTLSPDGLYTIIDYRSPQHATAVGAVEHFGVSLRQLSLSNGIRVRWMVGGRPATVNGQIPVQGGGTAPATQPMLPSISADMAVGSTGGDGISLTVTNNDPVLSIWVKRRAQVTQGIVSLEALVTTDPVVTTTVPIDAVPVLLGPGQSLTEVSDLVEVEDNQSVVFAAQYFQDLTLNGPFNNTHGLGPELGNVMTAAIASPGGTCANYSPTILVQPKNVTADQGKTVTIFVNADGNDMPLRYQWLKEGIPLAAGAPYSGVTTDELTIDSLDDSSEGFYTLQVSNDCGSVISDSALVFITGHNVPPPPLCVAINQQPRSLYSYAGGSATFVASAEGIGTLGYQWQIADPTAPDGWTDVVDGLNVSGNDMSFLALGAADSTLTLSDPEYYAPAVSGATGTLRCLVTSNCGHDTSNVVTLTILAPVPADLDGDFDVDADDLAIFVACVTGPAIPYDPSNPPAGCTLAPGTDGFISADLDRNGVIDQADFGLLQRCWTGPNVLADPSCAD